MAKLVDLIIDKGVFFDIHISAGDISLGLIVVVVGNKILHRVFREKFAKLRAKLRRQSFIMRKNKRGLIDSGNHVCHRKGFARTCDTKQRLHALACFNACHKIVDRLGLVACGLKRRMQFKQLFFHWQNLLFYRTL